jgi:hypothetical protein
LSINKKGLVKFREHEALNLWTVKHKELVPMLIPVTDDFDEVNALDIFKISQNSVIIKGSYSDGKIILF